MWGYIFGKIKDELPKFNNKLLIDYKKKEIDTSPEHIEIVYKEAVKLFEDQGLEYVGHRELFPEEKIARNLRHPYSKGKFNIKTSELSLFEFKFLFNGKFYYSYIYLPYMYNNAIVINDVSYYLQYAIIERGIYYSNDSIIIKVMRSPLPFWRSVYTTYTDNEGNIYTEPLILVKAHSKTVNKAKSSPKTSVILYLLTRYGKKGMLAKFGYSDDSILFLDKPNLHLNTYVHVEVNKNVYMYCKKDYLSGDDQSVKYFKRIMGSMVNSLRAYRKCTADMINSDDNSDQRFPFWRYILGKCIYRNSVSKDALLQNHVKKHLDSLSTYLDSLTLKRLNNSGVECGDIYDIFEQVFLNIDDWLVNSSANNLYERRIEIQELLLSQISSNIFLNFYKIGKGNAILDEKNISKLLRISPRSIESIYMCGVAIVAPSRYNDCAIFSVLSKKIRQSANKIISKSKAHSNNINSPSHKFSPSFVIESIYNNPDTNPGVSGAINPYVEIDNAGNIIKSEWAKELDKLEMY